MHGYSVWHGMAKEKKRMDVGSVESIGRVQAGFTSYGW